MTVATMTKTHDARHDVWQGDRCIGTIVKLRGRWQYVARVEDRQLPPAAHETPEVALAYVNGALGGEA